MSWDSGKVAYYHVQAISETYQQLQIVNRIAVVPKDFSCISEEILIRGAHPRIGEPIISGRQQLIHALSRFQGMVLYFLSFRGR